MFEKFIKRDVNTFGGAHLVMQEFITYAATNGLDNIADTVCISLYLSVKAENVIPSQCIERKDVRGNVKRCAALS